MTFLSEAEKQHLRDRIRTAEARTRGELVTVLARESDPYPFIPLLWASMTALAVPPVLLAIGLDWSMAAVSVLQLGLFLVLALALRWTPLKMRLIPKAVKLRRAARTAREVFLDQGLHNTPDRCALMIFVSLGEHYVEILADKGIDAHVSQDQWDAIVADFVAAVKAGRVAEGFDAAVDACGAILAEHFPAEPGTKNALPDHLIEL